PAGRHHRQRPAEGHPARQDRPAHGCGAHHDGAARHPRPGVHGARRPGDLRTSPSASEDLAGRRPRALRRGSLDSGASGLDTGPVRALAAATLLLALTSRRTDAFFLDDAHDFELRARAYTEAALATEHSEPQTTPGRAPLQLISHRTFVSPELEGKLAPYLPGGLDNVPGEVADLPFRINEAYVNVARGRLFLRLGRQAISWGESDTIALLDQSNPFNLTLGLPGVFQDIDEARIPLWTVRGTWSL